MIEINAKGLICPQPLIETKKIITQSKEGIEIKVTVDNEIAFNNIITFLEDMGAKPSSTNENNIYEISFKNPQRANTNVNPNDYCGDSKSDYVVVLKSNKMGEGDDDLGKILIKAFINSIPELDELPTHIVMYNSAVKLTQTDSGVLETLQELENRGVKIIVCGTCVEFFEMEDKSKVGIISNMYTISEIKANTGHIIYP